MIPTREQIDEHYSVNALAWLRAMRDEIDRLTDANANLTRQVEWEQRAWPMWMEKALGKPLEGRTPSMVQVQLTKRFDAIQADLDRANTEAALARDALAKATTERDATAKHRDDLIALCRTWEAKLVAAGIKRQTTVSDGIAELIRQRDEFRSLTRPPKMEARIESLMEDMLRESIDNPGDDPADLVAIEERIGTADERFVVLRQDISEMANLQSALAKATTPAPEREAAIRAWKEDAIANPAKGPRDLYLLTRDEICTAVALMRSAGDPDAKLRELRWWFIARDLNPSSPEVRKIDELLARPEPSTVYSRGKTIAESAEPPTAYYPPAPVEIWPEKMKRQTLVGKFEPATVEQAESERDALKAKLAEAGHGGIFIPDEAMVLRAENAHLKAKLAALVEATAEVHEKLRINADGKATVTVGKAIALRRELGEALAAAKVPPDLDQLTR